MGAQDAAELVSALVAIDSVNPDLVPGGAGEEEVASYVAEWMRDAGLDVEVDEAAPGRPSVVGTARGSGGGRSLMERPPRHRRRGGHGAAVRAGRTRRA